jgi:putative AlgH/UPF0301 family transcriptional regulator
MMDEVTPGTLLVAPPAEDDDATFGRTVVLIVDREENGITTGLVLNRPTERRALEVAALAAVFVPDLNAPAFWGGPIGEDPVALAELESTADLEWFHLGIEQRRPFPFPGVGLVALGEHADAFDGRIRRARLFVGLTVWHPWSLAREIERGEWWLTSGAPDDVFTPTPEALLKRVRARAQRGL